MIILITGSKGQLGNELKLLEMKFPEYQLTFTDVEELDITDMQAVSAFFIAILSSLSKRLLDRGFAKSVAIFISPFYFFLNFERTSLSVILLLNRTKSKIF